MSPEQLVADGHDIDTRSDIYSLGVLLYELLVGTTPIDPKRFETTTIEEVHRIIREEEPPTPGTRLIRELALKHAKHVVPPSGGSAHVVPASAGTPRHVVPASAGSAPRASKPSRLSASEPAEAGTTYAGTTSARRLSAHETRNLIQQLRGDLDWIVMKALEKEPSRRYETANGLAMDLARYLNDEPIVARAPSRSYQLRKFVRRHRQIAGAVAIVAAALAVATLVSAWHAIHSRRSENRAVETLRHLQLLRAEELFDAEKETDALTALARLLRDDPKNAIVAQRLFSALGQRQFALPVGPPMQHGEGVWSASYSPDGRWVVSCSSGNTARTWNAETGAPITAPLRHTDTVWMAEFDASILGWHRADLGRTDRRALDARDAASRGAGSARRKQGLDGSL